MKYRHNIRFNGICLWHDSVTFNPYTVECRYNAAQYCKILHKYFQELRQNIYQMLDLKKAPHSSPLRASYGVSVTNNYEIIDHVIMAPHCSRLSVGLSYLSLLTTKANKYYAHTMLLDGSKRQSSRITLIFLFLSYTTNTIATASSSSLSLYCISMAQCKTAVSPLLTHWRYCNLTLNHRSIL